MIVDIEEQLEITRERMREHQAHLEALENGETFVPSLKKKGRSPVNGKKRKNTGKSKQGASKRIRRATSDEDELMESDEDSDKDFSDSDDDDDDDDDESTEASNDDPDSSEVEDEAITELTEDDLKQKIREAKDAIKSSREILNNAQTAKKEAIDTLLSIQKVTVKLQREKNAFCSLKRSEASRNFLVDNILTNSVSQFSRDVLKEDFRIGLKDLDGMCH